MTAPSTISRASRSASAVRKLDDPDWLRRRYQTTGDAAIALELGVHKRKVRAARERHGIPSHPVGPRRGVPRPSPRSSARPAQPIQSPIDGLTTFERRLIDRLRADRRSAATEALLAQRLHNAHDAKRARDTVGYEEALFAVSTVAARIAQHSRLLRNAA